MDFTNKIFLAFLCIVPLIFFLLYLSYRSRDKAVQKFAKDEMLKKIASSRKWNIRVWKMLLFSCGILFIVLATARPKWGMYFQEVQNYGRDVVVLLDLSKSMLAEDVQPTRIERAKKDIEDLVDALKGDRIALVAFAGRVEIRCPLTLDYNFFKWALDECNPGVVALGGTAIGDAIRQGVNLLGEETPESNWFAENDREPNRTKAILLITDGEDHETAPLEAAKLAQKKNITIFTVGFGDDKEGARIPVTTADGRKEYLRNSQGEIVWSRLNDRLLREISLATKGGVYFPVKTRNINMANVYKDYIAQMEAKRHQSAKKPRKKEQYQIFVLIGFLLLVLESLVMEGSMRTKMVIIALVMCILFCSCSNENSEAHTLNEEAAKLYHSGAYEKAKEKFQEAEVVSPENSILLYNIANTAYKEKKWDEARKYYSQAVYNVNNDAQKKQLFRITFNEGCSYYREAEELITKDSEKVKEVITFLQQSLRHFRKALEYKKNDPTTLHNLRFVKLALKNFIDKQYKKQQKEKEKQETPQVLLAQLRKNQIIINHVSKTFIRENKSLQELAEQQKQQLEIFDKLSTKLKEQMKAVQDKNNKQAFMLQIQMFKSALDNILAKIQKNDSTVIKDQQDFLALLDPFWELMASADLVISEDILLQSLALGDLSTNISSNSMWTTIDEHQAWAILSTNLFEKKFAELITQIEKQKQQQSKQPQQQKQQPKIPKLDIEAIKKLTKQALQEQGQAKQAMEKKQQQSGKEQAEKALQTLQKIAEKLGAQNKNQQQKQQQKKDQKKNQSKDKQKQQQKNQDKNKQNKKQQKQQQKKQMSKNEAAKMLQKIKKRMKDNKEKKRMYSGDSLGVDNDW